MWKDFKEFAMKGNVIDLAVGVVIGGAFGKIVASLVADIIMPVIGIIVGGVNFTELKYDVAGASIMYGQFIQSVFDFFIIALSIFLFIKLLQSMKREEPVEESIIGPTKEEVLLTEIRDLLKK